MSDDANIRDGHEALRLATHALRLTGGRELRSNAAAAAAYAQLNDFTNAVKYGKKALFIAKRYEDTNEVALCIEKLKMYGTRHLWLEPKTHQVTDSRRDY